MNEAQTFLVQLWHEIVRLIKERKRKLAVLVVVALALSGVIVYLLSFLPEELARFGYLGAFLASLLGNSTIVVCPFSAPIGLSVVLAIARTAEIRWLVPIAASVGGTLGEITGYAAGYGGRRMLGGVQKSIIFGQVENWFKRYGSIIVPIVAFFPLGVFDFLAIALGSARFSPGKFFLLTLAGRLPRSFIEVYLGIGLISLLLG